MTSHSQSPPDPGSTRERIVRLSDELTTCRRSLEAERSLRAKLEGRLEETELSEQRLRQVEQDLAQKTAVLEATLENMDQGIYMLDRELHFVAYNQRLCKLLDLPDALLATRPTAQEVIAYQRARGEYSSEEEGRNPYLPERMGAPYHYERRRPNGTVVEVRSSPLPEGGWVRTVSDITERARVAEELRRAKEAAEAGSRAKSEFLAMMSHEIRTPMNAMIGMTELTLETELTDEQTRYLEKALDASGTLLAVINDILDFSKIEAGQLELEHVTFDLNAVLDRVATVIGLEAKSKSLGLVFSVAPEVPRKLVGDPLRLGQVLTNLADNAVKFSVRGDVVIEVGLGASDEDRSLLSFAVHDNGIGLGEEEKRRVFEAFSQADLSTTRRYGGTGLGLPISKRLVELMGGGISVEGAPGQGATVRFTAELEVVHDAHREPELPLDLRGLRTLVVDDSPTARDILAALLTTLALEVDVVASAEEAIAALGRAADRGAPYGLVLMDWTMPGLDGLEALRRLAQQRRLAGMRILIMVNAYEAETLLAHEEAALAHGVLTMTLSLSALFDKIMETFGEGAPTRETASPETGRDAEGLEGIRVLLVEDNVINQQVAQGILERAGVTVEIAGNGRIAVERVCEGTGPDLDAVLMDLHMPDMDGYEATRLIRERVGADLPIIAMTAHAMVGERERCLRAGMNEHVAKPVNPAHLFGTLRHWVTRRRAARKTGGSPRASKPSLPDAMAGIALGEGTNRLGGDVELYRRLLAAFPEDADRMVRSVNEALARGDRENAARAAHSLKGTAGNLSARRLHRAAAALEATLAATDGALVVAHVAEVEAALAEVARSIAALESLDPPPESRSRGAAAPSPALGARLDELAELLEARDLGADTQFAAIEAHYDLSRFEPEVRRLRRQLARLRYEEALGALDAIRSLLDDEDSPPS